MSEGISKLHMPKIMSDLGFRMYIFLLRWALLLTVERDGANIQLQYFKSCVEMCFGNYVMSKIASEIVFEM